MLPSFCLFAQEILAQKCCNGEKCSAYRKRGKSSAVVVLSIQNCLELVCREFAFLGRAVSANGNKSKVFLKNQNFYTC